MLAISALGDPIQPQQKPVRIAAEVLVEALQIHNPLLRSALAAGHPWDNIFALSCLVWLLQGIHEVCSDGWQVLYTGKNGRFQLIHWPERTLCQVAWRSSCRIPTWPNETLTTNWWNRWAVWWFKVTMVQLEKCAHWNQIHQMKQKCH